MPSRCDGSETASPRASFDDRIGGRLQRQWHGEAKLPCGLQVDDQVELDRLLDRQVGRPCAFENAIDIGGRSAEQVRRIDPIRDQAAALGKDTQRVTGGKPPPGRQSDDPVAMGQREAVRPAVPPLGFD